ncbi:hypothetical protein [Microbacterium testaceum]|uniref:Uncharacterized protein n=1 Tax=Microbacterium testaceum TaxID=2033 RepID=A0A147F3Z5_MICTE|nr:hypothetical protein [Microbacterium testaceum]KTS08354.1 hypothetical protein RSA3_15625 [Microbacterium testaceum]
MIAAGLLLLAVGAVDLLRQMVHTRRWLAFTLAAVALVAVSAGLDAVIAGLLAVAVAAIWTWVMPERGPARAGLWPVALLGLTAAACVVIARGRPRPGPLGELWATYRPTDTVSVDVILLVIGCLVFLLESGNAVVRIALRSEMGEREAVQTPPPDAAGSPSVADGAEADGGAGAPRRADDPPADALRAADAPRRAGSDALPAPTEPGDAVSAPSPVLKGGRLIGPLERILVFVLTLAGAYTLIAAVFAAKGIVRFPEISADGKSGNRAEYFLIGSLVSWVTALAAAFLVWWGVNAG